MLNRIEKEKYIYGSLFLIGNKLQVLGDTYLKASGITSKQWLLTVMLAYNKDKNPTLTEMAEFLGSSRQNVKQLALKLEEKGFLRIERDSKDSRILRLKNTEKSQEFWESRQTEDIQFIVELFKTLTLDEVDSLASSLDKLFNRIEIMKEQYKGE
jgi:DNA-binding MarR family transcriptional regulator